MPIILSIMNNGHNALQEMKNSCMLFFPGFSFTFFIDMQNKDICASSPFEHRNLFHYWIINPIDFLFFFSSFAHCPKEKRFFFLAYKSVERSVIYIRLTTGWDKSSVQLRCFIMSMRITLNSLNCFVFCCVAMI